MNVARKGSAAMVFVAFFVCLGPKVSLSQVIHGIVLDEDSTAIANAEVSIPELGRAALTDQNGRFAFSGIPKGTQMLKVQRIGYDRVSHEVAVSSDSVSVLIIMHGRFCDP